MPPKIPASSREQVRVRANFLCEYCHTAEQWQLTEFTIDHVIPVALGGSNDIGNLALACFHCNRRKSNKILTMLEDNVAEVPLFNPRMMRWQDHFVWSTDLVYIVPLTDVGRVTVKLLDLNRPRLLQLRYDDILVDRHPPLADPVKNR